MASSSQPDPSEYSLLDAMPIADEADRNDRLPSRSKAGGACEAKPARCKTLHAVVTRMRSLLHVPTVVSNRKGNIIRCTQCLCSTSVGRFHSSVLAAQCRPLTIRSALIVVQERQERLLHVGCCMRYLRKLSVAGTIATMNRFCHVCPSLPTLYVVRRLLSKLTATKEMLERTRNWHLMRFLYTSAICRLCRHWFFARPARLSD